MERIIFLDILILLVFVSGTFWAIGNIHSSMNGLSKIKCANMFMSDISRKAELSHLCNNQECRDYFTQTIFEDMKAMEMCLK